jgi:hypothetical protein
MIVLRVVAAGTHTQIEPPWKSQNIDRAAILGKLQAMPGQHLAIVRYSPSHSPHSEWVYNDADIDAAKVVWSRDMGKDRNQELLQYFHGRKVWQLEGDSPAPQLVPYPD